MFREDFTRSPKMSPQISPMEMGPPNRFLWFRSEAHCCCHMPKIDFRIFKLIFVFEVEKIELYSLTLKIVWNWNFSVHKYSFTGTQLHSPGVGNATHSSILAWKIPWTEEPRMLQSRGSQGVIHNWANTAILQKVIFIWSPYKKNSKESACNLGDLGLIPGSGRPQGKWTGYPPSILAWRIPWTEDPGGLQSMRSQRVGHHWATNTETLVSWEWLNP